MDSFEQEVDLTQLIRSPQCLASSKPSNPFAAFLRSLSLRFMIVDFRDHPEDCETYISDKLTLNHFVHLESGSARSNDACAGSPQSSDHFVYTKILSFLAILIEGSGCCKIFARSIDLLRCIHLNQRMRFNLDQIDNGSC